MISLSDLIKEATRDIEDVIRQVDRKVGELETERRAAVERLRVAEVNLRESDPGVRARRDDAEALNKELQALEEQIRELTSRKREKEREREEALRAASLLEEEVARVRKEVKRDDATRARVERELGALDEERHRHRRSLIEARLRTVQRHAEKVWAAVSGRSTSIDSQLSVRAAAEALARARTEDPGIAALCEARDQWQKFLSGMPVPMVRETAQRELQKIESELERRFPGSLKGQSPDQSEGDFEDLYWFPRGEKRIVLVPIPERIFRSLAEGGQGSEETLAMRLVWSACRAGLYPSSGASFRLESGVCVLEVGSEKESNFEEVLTLDLGAGLALNVLISRLPSELEEVLN